MKHSSARLYFSCEEKFQKKAGGSNTPRNLTISRGSQRSQTRFPPVPPKTLLIGKSLARNAPLELFTELGFFDETQDDIHISSRSAPLFRIPHSLRGIVRLWLPRWQMPSLTQHLGGLPCCSETFVSFAFLTSVHRRVRIRLALSFASLLARRPSPLSF